MPLPLTSRGSLWHTFTQESRLFKVDILPLCAFVASQIRTCTERGTRTKVPSPVPSYRFGISCLFYPPTCFFFALLGQLGELWISFFPYRPPRPYKLNWLHLPDRRPLPLKACLRSQNELVIIASMFVIRSDTNGDGGWHIKETVHRRCNETGFSWQSLGSSTPLLMDGLAESSSPKPYRGPKLFRPLPSVCSVL